MDGSQFDCLTRSLSDSLSRRRLTRLLGGLGLGGPLALLGVNETEAKRKKGRNKKKKKRRNPPSPSGGCPSGEKPCDGDCIPRSRCCNNADCPVSGQVCTPSRQCACPAALPDICGGACLAACLSNQARDPTNCRCCIQGGYPNGGADDNCCSGRSDVNGNCVGFAAGSPCEFDVQCEREYCLQGTCSSCYRGADYCEDDLADYRCAGGAGRCLTAVDGTTRCGIPETGNEGDCGWCTSNFDCDQGVRPGAFCAVDTGPQSCGCPQGQTFCARPA